MKYIKLSTTLQVVFYQRLCPWGFYIVIIPVFNVALLAWYVNI